jgi:hypothetical protein
MELLCNANLVYLLEDKRFEGLTGKYRERAKQKQILRFAKDDNQRSDR